MEVTVETIDPVDGVQKMIDTSKQVLHAAMPDIFNPDGTIDLIAVAAKAQRLTATNQKKVEEAVTTYQQLAEQDLVDRLESGGRSPDQAASKRVVVAGSRGFSDYVTFSNTLMSLLKGLGWDPADPAKDFEIVQGEAKGPDTMAREFAAQYGIPCKAFPAQWDNVELPNAVIKRNRFDRPYNAAAGHWRNGQMARYGTHLALFWDGRSKGSENMYKQACANALDYVIVRVDSDPAALPEEHEENAKPYNALPRITYNGIKDTSGLPQGHIPIQVLSADGTPMSSEDAEAVWQQVTNGGKARLERNAPVLKVNSEGVVIVET